MAKPVTLSNGRNWATKKACLAHFKQMLANYSTGDRVANRDDHADLCALLERYDATAPPNGETKTGVGIDHFSREINVGDKWATNGFHVHRTDGTSDDFSYIDAVNLEPNK